MASGTHDPTPEPIRHAGDAAQQLARDVLRQIQTGTACYQAGQYQQAAACFQSAVQADPDNAQAWYYLGCIAARSQQLPAAIPYLRRAIELDPANSDAFLRLGSSYYRTGQLADAIDVYLALLRLKPDHAAARSSLGACYAAAGDVARALVHFRQAIELQPGLADAHHNLGTLCQQSGALVEAAECFRAAIRLRPASAPAYHHLGSVLTQLQQLDEAIACFEQALRLDPGCASTWYNLGCALRARGAAVEAIARLEKALELDPAHVLACSNLGCLLRDQGNADAAREYFERALRIQPECLAACNNLGLLLQQHGRAAEALVYYDQALRIKPDFEDAVHNRLLCLHYCESLRPEYVFEQHVDWMVPWAHSTSAAGHVRGPATQRDKRLRIGYVSGDLRCHSVAFFLEPLLAHRNREQFDVVCYANNEFEDATTDRLRALCDAWRRIANLNHEQVAAMVRDDRIDILVDLSGHTAGNRLMAFALGPAPVQVTYLGYPNTTGLRAIQYRLTDAWADPPGLSDQLHTEVLVRLPHGFLCYQPPAGSPDPRPPPVARRGHVAFGCFNNPAKLTPGMLRLWSEIMKAVPDSRFILKGEPFNSSQTRQYVLDAMHRHGVQRDRIDLLPRTPGLDKHLGAYHDVDIALDTFPYHGTTTTCEALWMGVPVVVRAGGTHVSRVGVSLLTAVGLTELIAATPEQYVDQAVALARDPGRLAQLRGALRSRLRASPLMDAPAITQSVEDAYREMWRRWCTAPPTPPSNPPAAT